MRNAKPAIRVLGRSQLLVCGAAITTHLGQSGGRLPSTRQPVSLRIARDRPRSRVLTPGVVKMVRCMGSDCTLHLARNGPVLGAGASKGCRVCAWVDRGHGAVGAPGQSGPIASKRSPACPRRSGRAPRQPSPSTQAQQGQRFKQGRRTNPPRKLGRFPHRPHRMNAPVDVSFFPRAAKPLASYRPYWAERFGTAPFLPMSRAEMDALGWDSCDIILVTGDAYIDHPSFGMALVGRLLEAQGFRVGIITQPDWHPRRGLPGAGPADAVLRRHRRQHGFDGQPLHLRPQDPHRRRLHPGDAGGKRPDRAVIVYAQRCREAYPGMPVDHRLASRRRLRRIAHYDYWSDKVRRSVAGRMPRPTCCSTATPSARCVEVAHRLAKGETMQRHPRRARHRLHGRTRLEAGSELARSRLDRARHPRRASMPTSIPTRRQRSRPPSKARLRARTTALDAVDAPRRSASSPRPNGSAARQRMRANAP